MNTFKFTTIEVPEYPQVATAHEIRRLFYEARTGIEKSITKKQRVINNPRTTSLTRFKCLEAVKVFNEKLDHIEAERTAFAAYTLSTQPYSENR